MKTTILPQWNFRISIIKNSYLFIGSINNCMVRDRLEAFDLFIWKGRKLQHNRIKSQINQLDSFGCSASHYWEGTGEPLNFPDFSTGMNILDFILFNMNFFHLLKTPQQNFQLIEGLQSECFVLALIIPHFFKGK